MLPLGFCYVGIGNVSNHVHDRAKCMHCSLTGHFAITTCPQSCLNPGAFPAQISSEHTYASVGSILL